MKKQKFEIAKLDSANLVELDGFKQSQLKLVEDHPFVEINDSKSYQEAKKNRTALKTGRTTIEKQDKLIASTVSTFRKGTIKIKDELVIITKPHEEKQQIELDRWEKIIQDEKDREAKLEEERIRKIKDKIEEVKSVLNIWIKEMTFEKIEVTKKLFEDHVLSRSGFDFQEYQFLFDEMIEDQKKSLNENVIYWTKTEEKRLEDLGKDQQSKIDSIFREATEVIDGALVDNIETMDIDLNKILTPEFDFGELKLKFDEMVGSIIGKAKVKIEWLKEQKEKFRLDQIQHQKTRVINTREGALDLVFQMTVENYTKETIKIKEIVDQDFEKTVPEAMEEVQKLKDRVNDALKRKLEEIAGELKKVREAEEERMKKVMEERVKTIIGLGMVEQESETEWIGFGITITDERLYQEDDIQTIIDEINEGKNTIELFEVRKKQVLKTGIKLVDKYFKGFSKLLHEDEMIGMNEIEFEGFIEMIKNAKKVFQENDKKEKARQKRIKPERELLVDFIENGIRRTTLSATLKQPEMIEFKSHIESELNGFCDSLIETLKSK